MKLHLVTETFPPEVNGVAMTLSRWMAGMAQRGHTLTVLRPTPKDREATTENCPWTEVRLPGLPLPGYPDLRLGLPVYHSLRNRWSKERPDIVHIATEGPQGMAALFAAQSLQLPLASSFHTNFHSYGSHYGYGFLLDAVVSYLRFLHNQAAVSFAPSEDLIRDLKAEGFRHLRLLGRGVDTRLFNPQRRDTSLRQAWGLSAKDRAVVHVGRIAPEKNLPFLVETFQAMQQVDPGLKLILVGDGPLRSKLETGNADIIFAGMRHGEDLARHYASGDIFLFASITETFGNVVTEALASGLAVLAYDYAAPGRYIDHGHNGFLAPYDDAERFRALALELAEQKELAAFRQAAAQSMASVSWDRIIDTYEQTLENVIESARQEGAQAAI
ncbi:MAG: glycosyltransferase family 4 protein [Opitutales bacterium]